MLKIKEERLFTNVMILNQLEAKFSCFLTTLLTDLYARIG